MRLHPRSLLAAAFAAVVLALGLTATAADDLPQPAYDAFDRGDYATALAIVRPLAERGDARAQGALGYLHYFGLGVTQDPAEAYRWIRMGAEGGDLRSQLRLGILHDRGHGTPRNLWEAVRWYRIAAERGDAQAQYNVCVLLFNGDGGLRNLGEARQWCARAAEQGVWEAKGLLRRIDREAEVWDPVGKSFPVWSANLPVLLPV